MFGLHIDGCTLPGASVFKPKVVVILRKSAGACCRFDDGLRDHSRTGVVSSLFL